MKLAFLLLMFLVTSLAVESATTFQDRLNEILKTGGQNSETKRLQQLIDIAWKQAMEDSPETATYVGYPGQNGRWSDLSAEAIARKKKEAVLLLKQTESIDRSKLADADALNYDLFLYAAKNSVESLNFPSEWLAITQLNGPQQDPAQTISIMPKATQAGYEDILKRLRSLPVYIDQNIALLQEGLAHGVTQPRIALRDIPQQIRNVIPAKIEESPLYRPFKDFPPEVLAADRERLRAAAVEAIQSGINPAYERLLKFLEEKYIPGARETIACSALPNGSEWYAFNARTRTTTSLSPSQIHEIGKSEVKRIRAEMDLIIKETGFKGNFQDFLTFLRTDGQFFYARGTELLAGYRDISKRIDGELPRLFGKLPRTPYGVVPIPSYAEKSQTTAYYMPGALTAGRPGNFFANTYELRTRPKWEMEALTLHEAVPGHHLQIALAQELDGVPDFRKNSEITAFVEGWGLYSESLGAELGLYQDPYSHFGQLTYEMWRAIRLVVDTGMHSMGWTRQQAIDFFVENAGKAEHDIVVEVDRYIVWPGQALAYKIGQLKITELRATASKELGANFDIRAFHDELLGAGAMPLDMLETRMKNWITRKKGS